MAIDFDTLRTRYVADDSGFRAGSARIRSESRRTAGALRRDSAAVGGAMTAVAGQMRGVFLGAVAGAATVGVAGLGAVARGALDAVDKIDKVAISAQISRQRLQTLGFAAEQSGVDFDRLGKALQKLSVNVGDFAATGKGTAAGAFERLGIAADIANGKLDTTEKVFDEIIRRLPKISGEAERASIMADLFGERAGPEMARLLNQGEGAIRGLEDQLRQYGQVMDDEMIAKAVEARDKLTLLSAVIETNATVAFASMSDGIIAVSDAFLDFITFVKDAKRALEDFGITSDTILNALPFGADPRGGLAQLSNLSERIQAVLDHYGIGEIGRPLTELGILDAPSNVTTGTPLDPNDPNLLPPPRDTGDGLGTYPTSGASKTTIDDLIAASQARIGALRQERTELDLTGEELFRYQETQRLINEALKAGIPLNVENRQKIMDAAVAYGAHAEATAAAVEQARNLQEFQQGLEGLEGRAEQLEAEAAAMRQLGVDAETAALAVQLLAMAEDAGVEATAELTDQIITLADRVKNAQGSIDEMSGDMDLADKAAESFARGAQGALGGFIRDLRNGEDATQALLSALNSLADIALNIALNLAFRSFALPGFADGAVDISGPGGPRDDRIPVFISAGESVINAPSTAKYKPLLQAINEDRLPRLADGMVDIGGPAFAGAVAGAPMPDGSREGIVVPAPTVHLKNVNLIDPVDMLRQALASREGERVMVNKFQQSGSAFKKALGVG